MLPYVVRSHERETFEVPPAHRLQQRLERRIEQRLVHVLQLVAFVRQSVHVICGVTSSMSHWWRGWSEAWGLTHRFGLPAWRAAWAIPQGETPQSCAAVPRARQNQSSPVEDLTVALVKSHLASRIAKLPYRD